MEVNEGTLRDLTRSSTRCRRHEKGMRPKEWTLFFSHFVFAAGVAADVAKQSQARISCHQWTVVVFIRSSM